MDETSATAKGWLIKGSIASATMAGLAFGAVLTALGAMILGLSHLVDPALAAAIVAAVLFGSVGTVVLWFKSGPKR